ncbi:glycosyltransferase [Myxococcota bacterium]|nr:glycosyltransferase [Myxococcota bacterium]
MPPHYAQEEPASPASGEQQTTEGAQAPRLTVVIPVCNGEATLPACLGALRASTCQDIELLVVDDGSTDRSVSIAQAHGARVISMERQGGPARARNRGAAAAQTPILFFTDADVAVLPDTVARTLERFDTDPALDALFGSYTLETPDPGFFSIYKNVLHHYTHQTSREEAASFWTGCGAIRKAAFEAVGGFDETYGGATIEDIELGTRLYAAGRKIRLVRDIQATHHKRYTLKSLVMSDVFNRAIPWTALMLRRTGPRNDLNTTRSSAIALLTAYTLVFGLLLGLLWAPGLLLAAVSAPIFFVCNLPFYRFLWGAKGPAFTVKGVGANLLFYLYSGVGFWLGVGAHLRWRLGGRA